MSTPRVTNARGGRDGPVGSSASAASREARAALDEASAYLDGLIDRERSTRYAYERLDLRPIEALLEGLGRPEQALSVVHVAGSKGKGSTCLFAEAILRALGEGVATFTSPHLEDWTERFRLDGAPVSPERLLAAVERARPVVEALRAGPPETRPSFFDATTAIAFLLFAEHGVDRALVEVGLGGRLDSTNVVAPAVTCIASIELEHTDKLGDTEAAIAGEKAGILKPGVPLVLGALRPEAEAVVRARAAELGVPVHALGEAFTLGRHGPEASPVHVFEGPGPGRVEVTLATPGEAAARNAALALACVRLLAAHPPEVVDAAARTALAQVRLPARIERLANDPRVLIDSAHTAESARELAAALAQLAPDGHELLLSVSGDKDLSAILAALLPGARRVWTTRAEPTRSLPAEALAERVRGIAGDAGGASLEVEAIEDPEAAARRARAALAPGHLLCACGSVYLAGVARRVLAKEHGRD